VLAAAELAALVQPACVVRLKVGWTPLELLMHLLTLALWYEIPAAPAQHIPPYSEEF
jgi:hypothetical protein